MRFFARPEQEYRVKEGSASRRAVYRIGFGATLALVLLVVVTLPLSLSSVADDLLVSVTGRVIPIAETPADATAATHMRAHIAVVAIDEVQLLASLRVSGHLICEPECGWSSRLLLFSLSDDDDVAEGVPPSASIVFPSTREAVSQKIELPIRGQPIHYPFDEYTLTLGVVLQRIFPDGSVTTVPPAEAADRLHLTVQELLPREVMRVEPPIPAAQVHRPGDPFTYLHVQPLHFERPPYVHVMAVLLVVLIAAAAAYAVFLRPLQELIVNVGALVLGVWGIRAILTPANIFYVTAIDLALSVVIIFLLGAISVKALLYIHDRGDMRVLRRLGARNKDETP